MDHCVITTSNDVAQESRESQPRYAAVRSASSLTTKSGAIECHAALSVLRQSTISCGSEYSSGSSVRESREWATADSDLYMSRPKSGSAISTIRLADSDLEASRTRKHRSLEPLRRVGSDRERAVVSERNKFANVAFVLFA